MALGQNAAGAAALVASDAPAQRGAAAPRDVHRGGEATRSRRRISLGRRLGQPQYRRGPGPRSDPAAAPDPARVARYASTAPRPRAALINAPLARGPHRYPLRRKFAVSAEPTPARERLSIRASSTPAADY